MRRSLHWALMRSFDEVTKSLHFLSLLSFTFVLFQFSFSFTELCLEALCGHRGCLGGEAPTEAELGSLLASRMMCLASKVAYQSLMLEPARLLLRFRLEPEVTGAMPGQETVESSPPPLELAVQKATLSLG